MRAAPPDALKVHPIAAGSGSAAHAASVLKQSRQQLTRPDIIPTVELQQEAEADPGISAASSPRSARSNAEQVQQILQQTKTSPSTGAFPYNP